MMCGFEHGSFRKIARKRTLGMNRCEKGCPHKDLDENRTYKHGAARRSSAWHSWALSPTHVPRNSGILQDPGILNVREHGCDTHRSLSTTEYEERRQMRVDDRREMSGRAEGECRLKAPRKGKRTRGARKCPAAAARRQISRRVRRKSRGAARPPLAAEWPRERRVAREPNGGPRAAQNKAERAREG